MNAVVTTIIKPRVRDSNERLHVLKFCAVPSDLLEGMKSGPKNLYNVLYRIKNTNGSDYSHYPKG